MVSLLIHYIDIDPLSDDHVVGMPRVLVFFFLKLLLLHSTLKVKVVASRSKLTPGLSQFSTFSGLLGLTG